MNVVITETGLSTTLGFEKEEIINNILNQNLNFTELNEEIFNFAKIIDHQKLFDMLSSNIYGKIHRESFSIKRPYIQRSSNYLLEHCKNFNIIDKDTCGLYLGQAGTHPARVGKFFIQFLNNIKHNAFDVLYGTPSIDIFAILSIMKLGGQTLNIVQECSSSALALGFAYQSIKSGNLNEILVGGHEDFNPNVLYIFGILGILSKHKMPKILSSDRDGIIPSEGGSVTLLKNKDYLNEKDIPKAEILGFKSYNSLNPAAVNKSLVEKICKELLLENNLEVQDIDLISLHATGTTVGDINETKALENLFPNTPVTALKSYLGHSMGAASLAEVILTTWMMEKEIIFPIANLTDIDPLCGKLNYVREPLKKHIKHAIILSSGLGGNHTGILLKNLQN